MDLMKMFQIRKPQRCYQSTKAKFMDQIGQFPNENLYDTEVKQAEMLNPVMMKYDFIIEMLHSIL